SRERVLGALRSLGFREEGSRRALACALEDDISQTNASELLRAALSALTSPLGRTHVGGVPGAGG
ncbi:MAG TPA: hypothetical protein VIM73_22270, partial [Polyangiaceae bacterium]